MKKIVVLVLSCMVFTGCTNVNDELNKYREKNTDAISRIEWRDIQWEDTEWSHYYENYYEINDEEWLKLEKSIMGVIESNSEACYMDVEGFADENYHNISIRDVDSKTGNEALQILKELVDPELEEIIRNVKSSEKDRVTEEKIINNYGIICTKENQKISLNVIKSNISLIDQESKDLLNHVSSPEFMLIGMHVGKDNNMLKIETPMCIRQRFYSRDQDNRPSYYQIFRKNNGEITKVRFVVKQFKDTELDDKYMLPLQNIITYIEQKDTVIDPLNEEIKKVYKNRKTKASGTINKMNYQINRYNTERGGSGGLIEVVLEVK